MSRIGRLAGGLLVETGEEYFLVGDLKEPCDFSAAGFEDPGPIDSNERRVFPLAATGVISFAAPTLRMDVEGAALTELLARRLLIVRNASVSERLWNLVTDSDEDEVDARWLGQIPEEVWDIVRDSVLRCL